MKNALIIFVRNPVLGKVKTRLAAGIGDKKTLEIYKYLLQYTRAVTGTVPVTKFVFYTDHINEDDLWNGFEKRVQHGNDLGERMANAFQELFTAGYTKVCIIGSDCYALSSDIINIAFEKLDDTDLVTGPVTDGGYYLLGLTKMIPQLFTNKVWSTNTVFADTIEDASKLNLRVHQLPMLSDIDTEEDLRNSPIAFLYDL